MKSVNSVPMSKEQSALILGTVFNVLLNKFFAVPCVSMNVPTKFTLIAFSIIKSTSSFSSIFADKAFLSILEIRPIIFSPVLVERI